LTFILAAGGLSASHAEATSKLAGRMWAGRDLRRVKRGSRLDVMYAPSLVRILQDVGCWGFLVGRGATKACKA
jgi:hypothetical protein